MGGDSISTRRFNGEGRSAEPAELHYDPTKALARVTIASLFNPSQQVKGLLNPESLKLSIGMSIGKLQPIGWSHPILQYGMTEPLTFPLELYFSSQLMGRFGGASSDLNYYINWFSSFVYPEEKGQAPSPLMITWPAVIDLAFVIERGQIDMVRFHLEDLSVSAVRIVLDCIEYRVAFKNASMQRTQGYRSVDSTIERYRKTGTTLRMSGGGNGGGKCSGWQMVATPSIGDIISGPKVGMGPNK